MGSAAFEANVNSRGVQMQPSTPSLGPCRSQPSLSALHTKIISFGTGTSRSKAVLAFSYWSPQEPPQPLTSISWALSELNTSLRLEKKIYSSEISLTIPSVRSCMGGLEQSPNLTRRNICRASSVFNRRNT
jgi:hypothetical protein